MSTLAKKPLIAKIKPKLRHSLRVTLSALIAFYVMNALEIKEGVWLAFSAMQVVQASVGGSVKAVFERTLGTFAGAAYGATVASFASHDPALFPLVVVVAIAPAAFLAGLYPSFRIAPTTVAIVLFGEHAHLMGPVLYAEHRVVEIGIGCIIGMLVSLVIFPSRAHKAITKAAVEVLENFAAITLQLAEAAGGRVPYATLEGKHAELRGALTKMETQGEDAKRERVSRLTDAPDAEPLLRLLRRIRFDLVMIGRAVNTPLPPQVAPVLAEPMTVLAAQAAGLMRDAAAALGTRKTLQPSPSLDAAFNGFAQALSVLHREHALATLNERDTGRVFALSFTLEHLRQNLIDLAARCSEFGEEGAKEVVAAA